MLKHWFKQLGDILHMYTPTTNPYGCGTYMVGKDSTVKGYAWSYTYNNVLAVSR